VEARVQPWRFRWTLSIAFLVLIAFAAGIAMIGMVHQVGWIFSSREPMIGFSMKAARRSQSANNLHQIGLGIFSYHDAYPGLFISAREPTRTAAPGHPDDDRPV
jgi:hypothetical protein